jgi:hypothetical protein
MLNFTEQTGCGAVMLVWSFPKLRATIKIMILRETCGPMNCEFRHEGVRIHPLKTPLSALLSILPT